MTTFVFWLSVVVTLLCGFNILMLIIGDMLMNDALSAIQRGVIKNAAHQRFGRLKLWVTAAWHLGWSAMFILITVYHGWWAMMMIQGVYAAVLLTRYVRLSLA